MATGYTNSAGIRGIVLATTLAGTLDLLAAFALAIMAGGSPPGVLRGIAGAVIDTQSFAPPLVPAPVALALIGLALHFTIMAAMVIVYLLIASRVSLLNRFAPLSGIGYGLILWWVMYWVVLPRRWPTLFPIIDPIDIAAHVLLVGIPIALVVRRASRWS